MKNGSFVALLVLGFLGGCSESQPQPPIPQIPSAEGLHFSAAFFKEAAAQNQTGITGPAGEQHNDHFQQALVRADNLGTYPEAVLGRAYAAMNGPFPGVIN